MNRPMMQAVLVFSLCPLLVAQQPRQAASLSTTAKHAPAGQQAADAPQASSVTDHNQILKNAQMIYVASNTDFLTVSTMDRALLNQKNWEKLDLNIVESCRQADLQLRIDRLIFTHIHTYVLTDRKTGIVLASGRVTALDGVVASGPMAEQIVKILSAARLPAQAAGADRGL
jgi:hypothetical protein